MTASAGATPRRVLVVDDEPAMRDTLSILFRRESYDVATAAGCASAVDLIKTCPDPFPVVLTDLRMPDGDGFTVMEAAKQRSSATEVIVMTGYHEHAYDAMRRGAYDFVSKPFPSLREVLERVGKAYEKATIVAENELLRAQVSAGVHHPWIARSPAMRRIMNVVDKIASTRTTVLVTGESGTGKERVARLLHDRSDRSGNPFVVVNCGALPEALIESELFGHERGAFTGAAAKHSGMLREAEGGTLLLDEIGELPMPLQVKLLRVLQERKVRPVGGTVESEVDVRILAATNRNIEAQVNEGAFRKDLYYRLNVIRIEVPPLRERREDLALLVDSFIRRFASEQGKAVRGIQKEAFDLLSRYNYPGNVRELENILERAVALTDEPTVGAGDLPEDVRGAPQGREATGIELPTGGCDLDAILNSVERRLITQALERHLSVRKNAATALGITFRSLRYRMGKLGIEAGDGDDFSNRQGEENVDGEEANVGRDSSPDVRTR
jgi:two-component system, NtrC family, response regulator PilR